MVSCLKVSWSLPGMVKPINHTREIHKLFRCSVCHAYLARFILLHEITHHGTLPLVYLCNWQRFWSYKSASKRHYTARKKFADFLTPRFRTEKKSASLSLQMFIHNGPLNFCFHAFLNGCTNQFYEWLQFPKSVISFFIFYEVIKQSNFLNWQKTQHNQNNV